MFEELAEKMGATLSVSRPLVDAGWMPSSRQVGQSGKTVKPDGLPRLRDLGCRAASRRDEDVGHDHRGQHRSRGRDLQRRAVRRQGRPVRRRGRAREALLADGDTRDVRRSLRLADRSLVRADRRLDGDLRVGRAAARAQVPARAREPPGRPAASARRPDRADRAHPQLDQAPRRRRRARARDDLLRLRRALHRDGDPRVPGRLRGARARLGLLAGAVLPRLLAVPRRLRRLPHRRPRDPGGEAAPASRRGSTTPASTASRAATRAGATRSATGSSSARCSSSG